MIARSAFSAWDGKNSSEAGVRPRRAALFAGMTKMRLARFSEAAAAG